MSLPTAKQLLQSITDRLTTEATIKKVYGEPITSGQKTIIPVARAMLGFGGGFGEGRSALKGTAARLAEGMDGQGEGGGMGGGLMVQPLGVVEITPEQTRYVPLSIGRYVVAGIALGLLLGGLVARRSR